MSKFFLIIILVLATYLRLNQITTIPALNADEAAIGYNAYSLLETGKDEHGKSWPLVFKSFGDYKPGIYFYLVMPFIKILGLSILAIRLPAAILSIASVYIIYLLTIELIKNSFQSNAKGQMLNVGLIASLLLAISPWHIHFSRGGWETQVSTFFLLLGTYFFLKALTKPYCYLLFVTCYVLSIYTYHSMRVIAPLLGISIILIYRHESLLIIHNSKFIIQTFRWQIISLLIGVILMIPFLKSLTSESGLARAQGVSIFADSGPLNRVNQLRGEHSNFNSLPAKLIHNKFISYTLAISENYLQHFSGNFLFVSGDDIQRNKVPDFGQLYIVTAPFLLIGLFTILINLSSSRLPAQAGTRGPMAGNTQTPGYLNQNSNKPLTMDSRVHWNDTTKKSAQFILIWILIAPLAAALTFQSPHALRAFNMVIPLTLITAIGINTTLTWINQKLKNKIIWSIVSCLLSVVFLWDVTRYIHQYYRHMIPTYPFSSQYGFQELVPWIESHKSNYDHIFITDRYDQPYILFLFYSEYSPQKFQSQVILTPRDKFGFSTVNKYDNYHFESINYENLKQTYPNSLIIGTDEDIPSDAPIIKEIKLPNSDHIIFQVTKT